MISFRPPWGLNRSRQKRSLKANAFKGNQRVCRGFPTRFPPYGNSKSGAFAFLSESRLLTRQRATHFRRETVMEIYLSRLWIRCVIPRGYIFKSGRKFEGHEHCERKFDNSRTCAVFKIFKWSCPFRCVCFSHIQLHRHLRSVSVCHCNEWVFSDNSSLDL